MSTPLITSLSSFKDLSKYNLYFFTMTLWHRKSRVGSLLTTELKRQCITIELFETKKRSLEVSVWLNL